MIFIPYNVPSSKNSKIWTGKVLIWSKTAMRYKDRSKEHYLLNKRDFINMLRGKDKPYHIGFHFVRDNRHVFDFINMVQTVQDLMIEYGYIDDDNCDEMLPFPLAINDNYYSYDKNKPGVYIEIL